MTKSGSRVLAVTAAAALMAGPAAAQPLARQPVAVGAERATASAIERARAIDGRVGAILALDPTAMAQARTIDSARWRGPLAGQPMLVKDNIETRGPLATTAGTLALIDNVTGRDAPLVARLRGAGVVILGKTNLSEWANIRSSDSISGWSAVGGQTRNPYALDRNACGSSSGSGAAVAAGLAPAAIGTETDGSITCPAAVNGIVGFKPTVGLVSRTHIVPISASQDTAGPMTRDASPTRPLLLTVIAGTDPADPATARGRRAQIDYAAGAGRRRAERRADRRAALRQPAFGTDRRGVRAALARCCRRRARSWSRSTTSDDKEIGERRVDGAADRVQGRPQRLSRRPRPAAGADADPGRRSSPSTRADAARRWRCSARSCSSGPRRPRGSTTRPIAKARDDAPSAGGAERDRPVLTADNGSSP